MTEEYRAELKAELRFLLRQQQRISQRIAELQEIVEWPVQPRRVA